MDTAARKKLVLYLWDHQASA